MPGVNPTAWLVAHKTAAAGGAAVAVLGLLAAKKKAAAAAGAAPTTAATTPAGTVYDSTPVGAASGSYDSTAQDTYNSLEGQLQVLASQVGSQPSASVAPAVGSAAFGQHQWNIDSAYAATQGIVGLQTPSDLASYGQTRYDQNLYAANNAKRPSAKVPGGNQTVSQAIAENQAFQSGALGAAI